MGSERLRVLIADDSEHVRKSLVRLLSVVPDVELIGQAEDGLQALEGVHLFRPDLLILDINMPEMSGLEVLRQLKTPPHEPCIIVFTGQSRHQYREQCLAAGADYFFEKGTQTTELIETLKELSQ